MEVHWPSHAVAACAEFPNDNPALHRGAIWCCVEVGGDAVCEPAVELRDVVARAVSEPTPTQPIVLATHEDPPGAVIDEHEPRPQEAAAETPAPQLPASVCAEMELPEMALAEAPREVQKDACVSPAEDPSAPDDDRDRAMDEPDGEVEDVDGIEVVDDLEFDDPVLEESAGEQAAIDDDPATPQDPFAVLVRVVEEVAREAGCAEDSVRCLRALLGVARLEGDAIPDACADALVAAGVLERTPRGLTRVESFGRQVIGWQGVLRGQSEDFAACGAAMLDEWCASIMAKAMGNPSRAEGLRRELRRRGVAAFGLVADAA